MMLCDFAYDGSFCAGLCYEETGLGYYVMGPLVRCPLVTGPYVL
jgi:hypothetical protein